jgi:hypothetical protein
MYILASLAWLVTIYQFLVSWTIIQFNLSNYLATSVDVERTFSQGRLLLSHVRSRLSVQSTRALMCLGVWSLKGYVKDDDILPLPELLDGEEEDELSDNWDAI